MESIARLPLRDSLVLILGGGAGTRLWPLTDVRAKPAVPLMGKYRLIDIPISNAINSNMRKIFVLTQFNSASLNRHVNLTYKFDHFSPGFVEVLAAEQREESGDWFQGTADAVRQSWCHFGRFRPKYVLILSGDQLYRQDYRKVLQCHVETGANATVCCIPVDREPAKSFGLMNLADDCRIVEFAEKPKEDEVLDRFKITDKVKEHFELKHEGDKYLASMGIYIFNFDYLDALLHEDESKNDFGKHIIPRSIEDGKTYGYVYDGYWEDIGTINAFFQANLEMTRPFPRFDFYEAAHPIFTHPRFLPMTKFYNCWIDHSNVAEGGILEEAHLKDSVLGLRCFVMKGVKLDRVVMMGSDYHQRIEDIEEDRAKGIPHIGINSGTVIHRAILDKNVRIGKNCRLVNERNLKEADGEGWVIRDGIIIIRKDALIPDGTVI